MGMGGAEPRRNSDDRVECITLGQPSFAICETAFNVLVGSFAENEFHHDEIKTVLFPRIQYLDEIRLRDLARDFGTAMDALDLAIRHLERQHFNRNFRML